MTRRGRGLELAVAVGMALVGRRVGEVGHHQAHHVVRAVHQAVVAVGHHGQAARQLAHHDLGHAHHDVQAERDPEHAAHAARAPRRRRRPRRAAAHFIRAPFSSMAKIQPTTLPGWISPSCAPELAVAQEARGGVGGRDARPSPPRMRSKRSFQRAMLLSRRSTQPAQAQASTRSGVTSRPRRRRRRRRDLALRAAQQAAVGEQDGDADGDDLARAARRRARSRAARRARHLGRARPRAPRSMVPKARRSRSASKSSLDRRGGPEVLEGHAAHAVLLLQARAASRGPSAASGRRGRSGP